MTTIVDDLVRFYPKAIVAQSLDNLKDLGFHFSTRSGLTISIDDVRTPPDKAAILDGFEKEAEKVEQQFRKGVITDDERRQKEIEIWTEATDKVREAMQRSMAAEKFNPIDMMVGSGARGNIMQVRQIAGMRGLVANPRGEIIPRPIKSNFREGLSVLEYFISTHGARKGLADTALRTADSGYLTRRLVDVAQELIVREDDCGSTRRYHRRHHAPTSGSWRPRSSAGSRPRTSRWPTARSSPATSGRSASWRCSRSPATTRVTSIRVRSVLTCDAAVGICAKCYGRMMATGTMVDLGEAVGIIAAQSIGEPGTQLTMRTFHTGGVAGEDITHGLPRVVELFEARSPKGKATLARTSGVVRVGESDRGERTITIVGDDGTEDSYPTVSRRVLLAVRDGDEVTAGQRLIGDAKTPVDPKELLDIKGIRETQVYLVDEVQRVYREQGVSIHDKHVELIVRQMLRRVAVSEPGDSEFLPGEKVDTRVYAEMNRSLVEEGKQPAEGRPELMGITKASLATDSWLSAASFQETTRVLTEAAIEGRSDQLLGLKENVIIGKLIPAGTGMLRYRSIETVAPEAQPLPFYSSDTDQDLAEWLRSLGETPSVARRRRRAASTPPSRSAASPASAGPAPRSQPRARQRRNWAVPTPGAPLRVARGRPRSSGQAELLGQRRQPGQDVAQLVELFLRRALPRRPGQLSQLLGQPGHGGVAAPGPSRAPYVRAISCLELVDQQEPDAA